MFWPQLAVLATVVTVAGASVPAAAQTLPQPAQALLAEVSAEAGLPYLPAAKPEVLALSDKADTTASRLCIRAGLGLTVPAIAGPEMTVEHGLLGCPTNTGGLPIVVLRDPLLQPPPTSRAGDYNLDLTLHYRLLRLRHMQVLAIASEQGVGYSLGSAVSGNNLLLGMSLVF